MKKLPLIIFILLNTVMIHAQGEFIPGENKFRQLGTELATPNAYRTASGAPGELYWQQQADYIIEIVLDDENQKIEGVEKITYHNNSPDPLSYVWIQLDQNVRARNSMSFQIEAGTIDDRMSSYGMKNFMNDFDGGFKTGVCKG